MGLFTRRARKREQRDELLSAYVDGQLSAGEQARLEAQLAADSALQAELEALRHTVALVRDLPPVPIPRNFILPQKMRPSVAARPRQARRMRPRRALWKPQGKAWAAPLLTAATVAVSLIFVVVLAGDLLLSGMGGQAFAPAAAPHKEAPQVAMEPAPVSEEIEAEAEAEVEVEKAIPAATPIPIPAEVPPGATPTDTPGAEHYGVETPEEIEATAWAAGGGPVEEDNALAPSPSPAVERAAAAPTAPAAATVVVEKSVGEAEATPSEVAQVAPPVASEEERGASEDEGVGPAPVSLWRVLQVTLGLAALALALATIWAWHARRQ